MGRVKGRAAVVAVGMLLLAGCTQPAPEVTTARPTPTASPAPSPVASPPLQPVGEPVTIADGLDIPWSIVRLDSGSTLISQRNEGNILELAADGSLRELARIDGVVPAGEGGLLGLAVMRIDNITFLFAYFTAAEDNRIVRYELTGGPGTYALSDARPILTGIHKANNHNGGRLAIGPDGMLYATSGDAADTASAQDPTSLNGKILRMELDGSVPADNPIPGSLTWSFGHRNPQGLTWDSQGRMWAAEFGQDTWDEINRIEPGNNYGWPVVEGVGGVAGYVDPNYVWPTDAASPSGLTAIGDTLFLAGLGGERLWVMTPDVVEPFEYYTSLYGRIRDVVPGPDGTVWLLTNNTDGRGTPRDGDDRILQVEVGPVG